MEWESFGSVAAALVVLIGLVTPVLKLNASITKLTTLLEQVRRELEEVKQANSGSHSRIWTSLTRQERELNLHETRLQLLEKRPQGTALQ